MIVNLVETGWEIIYHRAHALLAAKLAGHWQKSQIPPYFYETLAAISHHDDLEREWESNHLTPAGAPLDFTLDRHSSLEKIQKLVEGARYRGRWVAMLVSMHICFLNQHQRGQSAEWDEFLEAQIQLQETWRKGLGITPDEADRAYQFMRWCDRLSLILVQRQLPDAGRALEITSGLDGVRYDIRKLNEETVTVEPWCFEGEQFTVSVESTYLSQLKFDTPEALTTTLKQAPIRTLKWTFIQNFQKISLSSSA